MPLSDSESESDSETTYDQGTPKKKMKIRNEFKETDKKHYTQRFRIEWLNDPIYKDCITQTNDPTKFRCKACNVILHCGKTDLKRHVDTIKHKNNTRKIRNAGDIASLFNTQSTKTEETRVHEENVAKAEIKLSCFFAEHNIALQAIEHLVPLLKEIGCDSKIIKGINLKRTKCTNIVKNVIAKKETDDLVSVLKNTKFSILIDESTDISNNKLLAVVVRYVANGEIRNMLLELITVDAKDCSAAKLFEEFETCLRNKQIPIKNVIGLASDNASVMIGNKNSFKTRLQEATDILVTIPCICHSAALISSKACEVLPKTPEEFMRSVATYFSYSSKRIAELTEMQIFFNAETKKILKLSSTRWLSMHQCVVRVLENWKILEHFFAVAVLDDNLKQADYILEQLKNKCTQTYFYFLKYVLNLFNSFNALFQSKKLLIHDLDKECKRLLKQLLINFIKPHLLNNINLNFSDPSNFLNLEKIDLGVECNTFIKQIPQDIANEIRKKCLQFYIVSCQELKKRFPKEKDLFESLIFLKPDIAINTTKPHIICSLVNVCKYFNKFVNSEEVDIQWKKISVYFDDEEKKELIELSPENFWFKLSQLKNYEDKPCFDQICYIANLAMSLPHSNAETERVFSIVNDVKCKKRNKLGDEALNAIAITRYSLNNTYKTCVNYNIEEKHYNLMKTSNLYNRK